MMENGIFYLMLGFAGLMLLYAALLAVTQDTGLIPRGQVSKTKNKKRYARKVAAICGMIGLIVLSAGLVGLWISPLGALISLAAGLIFSLWCSTLIMKDEPD